MEVSLYVCSAVISGPDRGKCNGSSNDTLPLTAYLPFNVLSNIKAISDISMRIDIHSLNKTLKKNEMYMKCSSSQYLPSVGY